MGSGPWGPKELAMTERLSMSMFIYLSVPGLSSSMQDFFFFFNRDMWTLSCSVQTRFSALEAPADCLLPLTSFS